MKNRDIYLTQPATTYSFRRDGRLSADASATGTAICDRRGLPALLVCPSLARWVRLPTVRRENGLVDEAWPVALWAMPLPSFGDCRYDLPGQSSFADDLVPGDVACHYPEERCQCSWVAAGSRVGQLQDSLGALTQVAASDGSTRSRADADNACPVLLQPVVCQVDLVHPSRQDRRRYADVDRVGCGMTRPKPSRHDACRSFCDNTDG